MRLQLAPLVAADLVNLDGSVVTPKHHRRGGGKTTTAATAMAGTGRDFPLVGGGRRALNLSSAGGDSSTNEYPGLRGRSSGNLDSSDTTLALSGQSGDRNRPAGAPVGSVLRQGQDKVVVAPAPQSAADGDGDGDGEGEGAAAPPPDDEGGDGEAGGLGRDEDITPPARPPESSRAASTLETRTITSVDDDDATETGTEVG